eukprot:scaffold5695_cov66-Phaeocystis_antarctica.AAC.3
MSACRPSETRRSARTLGRSRCEKTACCISAGRSSNTSATDIARRPAGARAGVPGCRPRAPGRWVGGSERTLCEQKAKVT